MERDALIETLLDLQRFMIDDYKTAKATGAGERGLQHHCPVCGQTSDCHNIGDKFHSCGLCGSVWQAL